jgi:hypothetical protein
VRCCSFESIRRKKFDIILSFIQALSQSLSSTILASERSETAAAANLVDRLASIPTIKAFNAGPHEQRSLDEMLNCLNRASKKLNAVWARQIRDNGDVHPRILVRLNARQGWEERCWRCHGYFLGLFDLNERPADVYSAVYRSGKGEVHCHSLSFSHRKKNDPYHCPSFIGIHRPILSRLCPPPFLPSTSIKSIHLRLPSRPRSHLS